MEQNPVKQKKRFLIPVKTTAVMVIILATLGVVTSATIERDDFVNDHSNTATAPVPNADSVESVQAFLKVYEVLMSPRCMNCHPSGDIPLQGDDSHLHAMSPIRGRTGKGVYAMKCSNCHQPENTPGLHAPPGNPEWHLPPANMKMVFQGKSAHELAKQLLDPKQNGKKDKKALLEHASDGLVKAGWNPGEGRSLPPMAYEDFKKAWITWIAKGAYVPEK